MGPQPIFAVPATTIPIVGEASVFQVRRIYCIGRNYAAHAIELPSFEWRRRRLSTAEPTWTVASVVERWSQALARTASAELSEMLGNGGTKWFVHAPSRFIRSSAGVALPASIAGAKPSKSRTRAICA